MTKSATARAQFWALAGTAWAAITLTLPFVGLNLPEPIIAAWGGVYMAGLRYAEARFDSRSGA